MKAKAGLVFLLASGAALVSAKPMPPFPVPVIQGDGDTLSVQLHGDEYSHYAETSDGYLLLKGEDGYYYYADSSASISPFRARNADRRDSADKMFLNGLDREKVKSLYINDKMEVRERKSYGTPARKRGSALYKPSADTWTLGEQTFLMILVNHTGATWTHTREAYDSLLNQTGYSRNNHFGSVRDYYIRQSGGLFQPTFKVIGPYNVGMSVAGNDVKVMQAALDSAVKAGDLTDLSVYAKESDGHVFVGLVLPVTLRRGRAPASFTWAGTTGPGSVKRRSGAMSIFPSSAITTARSLTAWALSPMNSVMFSVCPICIRRTHRREREGLRGIMT